MFVLGILARQGPQHGYVLRQAIEEQASDFAGIKLPTLYYHLKNLEKRGLVRARQERAENRPERTVFEITAKGRTALDGLVLESLGEMYRPRFAIDAALFFGDLMGREQLVEGLRAQRKHAEEALETIRKHRAAVIPELRGRSRMLADRIFAHHEEHFRVERRWIEQTLNQLVSDGREEEHDDENPRT